MQIASFGSYAPKPDLAGAYLGGQRNTLEAAKITQDAQTARAQMDTQFRIAEMANAARQAQIQQEALMKAQDLEVQKAYQQQAIGIKQRELDIQDQKEQEQARQAMQEYQAQQQIQKSVQEAMAGGTSAPEAFTAAVSQYGPMAKLPGTAYSDIIQNGAGGAPGEVPPWMSNPKGVQIEGARPGQLAVQTGKGQMQILDTNKDDKLATAPLPGTLGMQRVGGQNMPTIDREVYDDLKKETATIEKRLDSDAWIGHRKAMEKAARGDRLTQSEQSMVNSFRKQEEDLKEKRIKLKAYLDKWSTPGGGGGTSTTNRIGRFNVIHHN